MLEKAMHMNITEYRPQRIAEVAEYYCFAEAVFSIPEIMPEKIADNGGYIGKHGDNGSVYDSMLAEIYAERNKAKARRVRKPDNRTREQRLADWEQEKDRRKDIHLDWVERDSRRKFGHGKTHYWDSNAGRKIRYAEKLARADWELESAEIAEEEEWERFNRELEEFDRKWREEAEAEQRRMREYRKLRDLHEWLKYA